MQKFAVLLVLLIISGCSSLQTSFDYDPAVNFQTIKTWSWLPEKQSNSPSYHPNGLMDHRVRMAVEQALAAKGLKKVSAQQADVRINYLYRVNRKLNIDTLYNGVGHGPFPFSGMQSHSLLRELKIGVITIDVINRKNALIWRGSVRSPVRSSDTPQEKTERINKEIEAILSKLPPTAK